MPFNCSIAVMFLWQPLASPRHGWGVGQWVLDWYINELLAKTMNSSPAVEQKWSHTFTTACSASLHDLFIVSFIFEEVVVKRNGALQKLFGNSDTGCRPLAVITHQNPTGFTLYPFCYYLQWRLNRNAIILLLFLHNDNFYFMFFILCLTA